jgi:hypothetical protein
MITKLLDSFMQLSPPVKITLVVCLTLVIIASMYFGYDWLPGGPADHPKP